MHSLVIKNFGWEDVEELSLLINEGDSVERAPSGENPPISWTTSLQRWLEQPGFRPERDCFIGTYEGHIIGYVFLIPEIPLSRGVAVGKIGNEFLRRKYGRAIVQNVITHAKALGLQRIHVDIPKTDVGATALFKSVGFNNIRTHLHLVRTIASPEQVRTPRGMDSNFRMLDSKDVGDLTKLQNDAFTDSWGYCPNTSDQIQYQIFCLSGSRPDDVVLLEQGGSPVAYCWTHINHENGSGVIGMVGVRRDLQGHGLGRVVMTEGVNHLVRNGIQPIEITVDNENTPAVHLYKSLGFELSWKSEWYETQI